MRCSIINHPAIGNPIHGNLHKNPLTPRRFFRHFRVLEKAPSMAWQEPMASLNDLGKAMGNVRKMIYCT